MPPSCVSKFVDPPASCDEAQFELSYTHTQHRGAGVFGCRLCWPHLRPPWPAECCMRPGRLIHSTLAQTCHRMIYILHWHLYPPSLTRIQSIFHQHMQWDACLRTGKLEVVGGSRCVYSFCFCVCWRWWILFLLSPFWHFTLQFCKVFLSFFAFCCCWLRAILLKV